MDGEYGLTEENQIVLLQDDD